MSSAPQSAAVGLQRGNNAERLGGCTGKGWLPGQSGNPSGKRKGCVSLTATLKRELQVADAVQIIAKLLVMAKGGDLQAVKLIFERLDSAEVERRLAELEQIVYHKAGTSRSLP